MSNLVKLDVSKFSIGICFSEPVYFEDGKNMFLAAGKTAKAYHIAALKQWHIPYLLTAGHEINPSDYVPVMSVESEPVDELEEL
ncbi:MAG: phosphohydrolase [Treponema sp.]|nr:phosphohydrolase [Treponema sp.]